MLLKGSYKGCGRHRRMGGKTIAVVLGSHCYASYQIEFPPSPFFSLPYNSMITTLTAT